MDNVDPAGIRAIDAHRICCLSSIFNILLSYLDQMYALLDIYKPTNKNMSPDIKKDTVNSDWLLWSVKNSGGDNHISYVIFKAQKVNKNEIIEVVFPIIERSESTMSFIKSQLTKKFWIMSTKFSM
jgi:hypothetical protein